MHSFPLLSHLYPYLCLPCRRAAPSQSSKGVWGAVCKHIYANFELHVHKKEKCDINFVQTTVGMYFVKTISGYYAIGVFPVGIQGVLVGLGPDRYMTISVHTTSVHVFRQIRNLDHFGTCTTSVRVSRVPRQYIVLTTSVQPLRYNATSVHYTPRTLRDRPTVGPENRRRLSDDLLTL